MITLLILSVVLAASAPLISRQMKNGSDSPLQFAQLINRIEELERNIETLERNPGEVPIGAVMAFDLASCPNGWVPLTSVYAGTSDIFIRNIGTLAGARGTIQTSGLPNIKGDLARNGDFGFATNGNYRLGGAFYPTDRLPNRTEGHNATFSYNVGFDASRSNPIYSDSVNEVRPKSLALLYCRKD